MLESFSFLLILSSLLGFLAGLGVGGGSLLILWLTLVSGMEQSQARIFNLLFFLPSAVVATLFRWKQGVVDVKMILPAVLAGCTAAAAFSILGRALDTTVLKKLFGGLLLLTGIKELTFRASKK